jgi:hypothetical protein
VQQSIGSGESRNADPCHHDVHLWPW